MFNELASILNSMIALILALTFHEFAHAFVAYIQGDRTAKSEGRMTINPIPHIDPVGTLLFPLIGSIAGAAIIGWAKPVPVNPNQLRNPKWGYVLVALAGPMANLLLCALTLLFFRVVEMQGWMTASTDTILYPLIQLAKPMITINAILAFFNLLPLYPLDGGTIFTAFLPPKALAWYENYIAPYGMFILLALFLTNSLGWMGRLAMGYITFADLVVTSAL